MGRKVTFVELPTFDGVLPLASGYMETVCRKDPSIVASFQFEKISMAVYTSHTKILSTLEQSDADVYAFSCYVWNMGLVRRLLDRLLKTKPQSYFVLGGPQVMHQADKYLSPDHENVFICNGEGERTFANLLRSLLLPEPDFTIVRGLSFYHDKQLVTTEAEPRISDLSEIPSPFLEGVFEVGKYKWVIIETNRGCPFKCSYCYWGGAVGARVYKYDNERIEREIEWVSKSYCWYLYLADANWGMLKRDVDLSQFIVDCQKRNGAPVGVHFSGSKNTPDRVAEITRILHEGGLIATQNIALQTMDPEALKRVGRDNIKTSTYTQMQETLNQHDISSFLEIIWPLPGETLSSFQEGLALLCENGADSFSVYNLLLMNNVELNLKKEEYGLVAIRVPDPNSEAEVVVQTNEVDAEAFQAGMRYLYVVTCLYTLRGLWNLGRYLHANRIMKYVELFRSFVDFCWQDPEHPWTSFAEKSIQALDAVLLSNSGPIIHFVLHERREVFDEMLEKFVRGQEFWHDPLAQFFFEVDLLNRPYVYQNTPITPKRYNFTKLDVRDVHAEGYVVDIPSQYIDRLREYITIEEGHQSTNRFSVDHRRSQLPFIPSKSIREHVTYCFDISQKMKHILPIWRAYDTPQKSTRTR
jgi:tRNA A37 methylthiotransferase MiaB